MLRRVFGRLVLALALCWAGGLAAPTQAQSLWERLVIPGPLAEAHAKLQSKCANCHTSFSQGAQPELCLACHKDVNADIAANSGYHGRSAEAKALQCAHCHSDHEGRDFPLISFDKEVFDHGQTDYALDGVHATLPCESCHEPGKKYREAPLDCVGCHKADEPHKGALGTDCAKCHNSRAWTDTSPFDHSKTSFPLVGNHAKVACAACHQDQVYKGLPLTCIGCHRIQDVHQGRFGEKCETCHMVTRWTEVRFNHDTDTRFALTGAHKEAGCNDCHLPGVDHTKLSTDCVSCHRKDDAHAGQLGTACETCHDATDWRQDVRFDHDLTTFPLIGLHVLVPCEGCHLDTTFNRIAETCISCHAKDDVHQKSLGEDCAGCHNPNGWAYWIFDHDRQTRFELTGQHAGLVCVACHALGSDARQQDAKCDACHTTETFKGAKLR
jgi:hypothetical protein